MGAVECCGAGEQSEGCERMNEASHQLTLFKRDCYVLKQILIAENVKEVKVEFSNEWLDAYDINE